MLGWELTKADIQTDTYLLQVKITFGYLQQNYLDVCNMDKIFWIYENIRSALVHVYPPNLKSKNNSNSITLK